MRRFLCVLMLIFPAFLNAQPICTDNDIGNTLVIFKAFKKVKNYEYSQINGYVRNGKVQGKALLPSYVNLTYDADTGEGGIFILAYDLPVKEFSLYHGSNVNISKQFYSGKLDQKTCSIKFGVNNNKFIHLRMLSRRSFAVDINSRERAQDNIKTTVSFLFR